MIAGNPHQLEQVFINLISNACQALEERNQAISVVASENGRWIDILISDEGVGISRENLPQITDPFFTTKREEGGTGLGLSVTSQIVEAHGGDLSFQSEIGKGTEVRVRLPILEPTTLGAEA